MLFLLFVAFVFCVVEFIELEGGMNHVCVQDASYFMGCSDDGTLFEWNTGGWNQLPPTDCQKCSISPDGSVGILTTFNEYTDEQGSVMVLDVNTFTYTNGDGNFIDLDVSNGLVGVGKTIEEDVFISDVNLVTWTLIGSLFRDISASSDFETIIGVVGDTVQLLVDETTGEWQELYTGDFVLDIDMTAVAIHYDEYFLYALTFEGLLLQYDVLDNYWAEIPYSMTNGQFMIEFDISDDGFIVALGNSDATDGGGYVTLTAQLDEDTMLSCTNYDDEYEQGVKQCGYDDTHFTSEDIDDTLAAIEAILEDLEQQFVLEAEEGKEEVNDAFDVKVITYDECVRLEGEYIDVMNQRIAAEDTYDQTRADEEIKHVELLTAIGAYDIAQTEYQTAFNDHIELIDYLNYELYIIQEIRELLGPELGEVIVQVVIDYLDYDDYGDGWESGYPVVAESTFDETTQRFGRKKRKRRRRKEKR